jgi:hypothetical protein
MFCRLTLLALLISLPAATLVGQSTRSRTQRAAAGATHSVRWEQLPLADAVVRLNEISLGDVLLDRRVDPNQLVSLALKNATAEEVAAEVAAAQSLGVARLGHVIYLGPKKTADGLSELVALQRKEIAALPESDRREFTERRKIVWPRLTEPRGLVTRLVADHGWRVAAADRIPYDLWAAGELPTLPLADQLTLLLVGFDLTYQVQLDKRTIEIVPINWSAIELAPVNTAKRRQPPRTTSQNALPNPKQVFSLRIEGQPVGKVLEQLAQRLGWQIAVDELELKRAGRSLDALVSFNVENADEDQLLEALLTPAGLAAHRVGKNVRISPRDE